MYGDKGADITVLNCAFVNNTFDAEVRFCVGVGWGWILWIHTHTRACHTSYTTNQYPRHAYVHAYINHGQPPTLIFKKNTTTPPNPPTTQTHQGAAVRVDGGSLTINQTLFYNNTDWSSGA